MSNMSKAIMLDKAIRLLMETDGLIQNALGMSDECFDLHCGIEEMIETLEEYSEQLVEMQVTE